MIDQILDSFRKAAESSLQTQQDMFKQLSQQWPSAQHHAAGSTADLTDALQKRWRVTVTTALERDRELVDAAYESGLELVEQTFQLYQARSPEDCKRALESLWRKLAERTKAQSESQLRVLQTVSSTWLELEPKPEEPSAP
jgi:hypothetical protein